MDHRTVVYELVERWGNKPLASLRDSDRLLADVKMDGDDYGMSFVPELQKKLGFKAPRAEWEKIVTVADVLRLVEKHTAAGRSNDPLT